MRGLAELGLVINNRDGVYHPTERGLYLQRSHPRTLADAALMWAGKTCEAWSGITQALRIGRSSFTAAHGQGFFEHLHERPAELHEYHRSLASYARHDYQALADAVNFGVHHRILDAGGGTGELVFALLRAFPGLSGIVMDRPEVVQAAEVPRDLYARCSFIGGDIFHEWPTTADAVVLARGLHDWPDAEAVRILERAREAMPVGGCLHVVEMVVDGSQSGGLLDLNMLVTTGGMGRSCGQYGKLLAAAGFRRLDVVETGGVSSVIRARAI